MGNNLQSFNPVAQEDIIMMLQEELAATNREVMALTLELEKRVEKRTIELRNTQDELEKTNSELLQLTLELEDRVSQRTKELEKANESLRAEIAKKEETQKALLESEDKFKYIFDYSSISKSITLPTGEINVNQACCNLLGYTKEELQNKKWQDITHTDDIELTQQEINKLISGKNEKIRFLKRYIHKNGSVVWTDVSSAIRRNAMGEPLYFITALIDITERKRAEEALRESEKQVRRKLDAILSPDANISALELSDIIDSEKIQNLMDQFYKLTNIGIGIIDIKGKVLVGTGWQDICTKFHRINPETCRLCMESDLELSRDVPTGTLYRCKNNMWDMASPIKLGDTLLGNIFLGQFLFDDETVDYETFRRQAIRYGFNEQEYIAALERVPRWSLKTVDSAISFYTAFAEMIGTLSYANVKLACALEERKRAEEEINLLNAELEKRVIQRTAQLEATNRELEAFSYSVSHDLRAPLRSIDGFTKILEEDYGHHLDTEGKRICGVIRINTMQMSQLIDDLLAFSRLGRTEMKSSHIDMINLVNLVFDELTNHENRKRITFYFDVLPPIIGDSAMIKQVWVNLISNAIKYTSKRKEAEIKISFEETDNEITYFISDNGVGFDMKYIDKLFGVFNRLYSAKEFEGTGVGLAIVKRIINKHGGRVWAKAEVNSGATFYFSIPKSLTEEERLITQEQFTEGKNCI